MLNIDFKQIDSEHYSLKVNGITDSGLYGDMMRYRVRNNKVIPEIMKVKFLQLEEHFNYIIFSENYDEITDIEFKITLKDDRAKNIRCPRIRFGLHVEWELWNKQWSMIDFSEELKHYIFQLNDKMIKYYEEPDNISNGFGVLFYVESPDILVKDEFDRCNEIFKKIIFEVQSNLIVKMNKDSNIILFNFPIENKVACQQYLIYFTQFLRDIGIEAESELKNESGKVLFSVTPTDKNEGLERIKESLDIYLQLPEYKGFELYQNNEIAIQQLQANVMHLKTQLMLTNAAVQLKDATIDSLQLSNYQYKSLLESKKNNEEETNVLNDMITLKPYEFNGGSINLPKLFKFLKRKR